MTWILDQRQGALLMFSGSGEQLEGRRIRACAERVAGVAVAQRRHLVHPLPVVAIVVRIEPFVGDPALSEQCPLGFLQLRTRKQQARRRR